MPKEQPCSNKHSVCAPSSKNAKDKSNSTTLMAIRNNRDADGSSGRGSRCSSEKDSGYSDASDWQQTDVEDQRSNKSQSSGSEYAETSQSSQNQEIGQGNPVNRTRMPAGHQLSPIYIMNNMVLKQPDMIQKTGRLPQRNRTGETGSSGAAHVILLQQPNLLLSTLQLHKPSSRKSSITGKKINGTYLPILNSYPRIAPHPSKKPPDKSSCNNETQNLSKRVCTAHKNDDSLVNLPEQHHNKQPKLAVLTSGLPHSPSTRDSQSPSSSTTVSSSQGSTSGSSSVSTRGPHRHGSSSSARHRRFFNTVEILRQSGLLDITLRTKELLRQSNTTERDIAQLRQHTELLCQAASNPTCSLNGLTAWEHVHRSMAESGSYPNLEILQNVQNQDPAREPLSISTGDTKGPLAGESSEVPPSHFVGTFTEPNQTCPVPQQSHSGQGRELEAGFKSSEKVTCMPPDSSTG